LVLFAKDELLGYETTKSIRVETGWKTERVKLGERDRSGERGVGVRRGRRRGG